MLYKVQSMCFKHSWSGISYMLVLPVSVSNGGGRGMLLGRESKRGEGCMLYYSSLVGLGVGDGVQCPTCGEGRCPPSTYRRGLCCPGEEYNCCPQPYRQELPW